MKPQSGQGWRTACHRRICTTPAGLALGCHKGAIFNNPSNTQTGRRYNL
ncbi:hypothetical protein [Shewanella sp. KCT]|nr:hypothetical protein [Shewanella sp. KCT]